MIQDIAPHRYDNTFAPAAPAQSSPVLCFREGQVLLRRTASGVLALPCLEDLPAFSTPVSYTHLDVYKRQVLAVFVYISVVHNRASKIFW